MNVVVFWTSSLPQAKDSLCENEILLMPDMIAGSQCVMLFGLVIGGFFCAVWRNLVCEGRCPHVTSCEMFSCIMLRSLLVMTMSGSSLDPLIIALWQSRIETFCLHKQITRQCALMPQRPDFVFRRTASRLVGANALLWWSLFDTVHLTHAVQKRYFWLMVLDIDRGRNPGFWLGHIILVTRNERQSHPLLLSTVLRSGSHLAWAELQDSLGKCCSLKFCLFVGSFGFGSFQCWTMWKKSTFQQTTSPQETRQFSKEVQGCLSASRPRNAEVFGGESLSTTTTTKAYGLKETSSRIRSRTRRELVLEATNFLPCSMAGVNTNFHPVTRANAKDVGVSSDGVDFCNWIFMAFDFLHRIRVVLVFDLAVNFYWKFSAVFRQ